MKLKLFDYNLPKKLIAQHPIKPRDHSRLFVYDQRSDKIKHQHFYDLPKYLQTGDVLVFNNTKVFPARLLGKKVSGGKIEIFLLKKIKGKIWEVLIGGKRRRVGTEVNFGKNLSCKITKLNEDETWQVKFNLDGNKFWQQVAKQGQTPTPPYIKTKSNLKNYQTVYAKETGSVAAPTAGFHFTKTLLNKLKKQGVQIEFVTLHVGLGTFAPVKTEQVEKHVLHEEWAEIDRVTAKRLNQAKKDGRRIIAVGTTSIRALEAFAEDTPSHSHTSPFGYSSQEEMSATLKRGIHSLNPLWRGAPPRRFVGEAGCVKIHSGKQWVNIFIYPGYEFKFVDSVITNFHLPKSTLLMLIAAFLQSKNSRVNARINSGANLIKKLYNIAIKKKYRFYSFGDGMLIK